MIIMCLQQDNYNLRVNNSINRNAAIRRGDFMFGKLLQKGSTWTVGILLAVCVMFGTCAGNVYGGTVNNPDSEAGENGGGLQSSNANLKSLSVTPGNISPEFSPEITNYTINVSEDVDTVSVSCSVEETTSRVIEAGGFKRLQPGSNTAHVTVQAADGTKLTYNFTINRGSASGVAGDEGGDIQPESLTEPDSESDSFTGADADTTSAGTTTSGTTTGGAVTTSAGADAVGGTVPGAGTPASIDPVTNRIPIGGESIYASFQINLTYPQELLPEGFTSETYNYKGIDVQSAYFAAGNIRLLYLTTGDGTSSDFRIYYDDTDSFLDLLQIKGIDGRFIMPVRYEAQIKIPDNYTGTYLPWENKVISAYIYTELTGKAVTELGQEGEDASGGQEEEEEPVKVEDLDEDVEFYLLYAVNNVGTEGFYLYDIVEGTYQRYVERDTSYELDQSYFKYKDVAHRRFAIMCVMACLLVIAAFCIINLIMRNRELKADLGEDDEEDEDEDEDDEDEEELKENVRKKDRGIREAKSADEKERKPLTETAKKVEKRPLAETAKKAEKRPLTETVSQAEKKPETGTAKRVEKRPEGAAVKKAAKNPEGETGKKTSTETVKKAAKKAVREEAKETAKDVEIDASTLEEKIINQIQIDSEMPSRSNERSGEARVGQDRVRPARKPSNFKMINLSREPEASALDDDFEFEFINLEDD